MSTDSLGLVWLVVEKVRTHGEGRDDWWSQNGDDEKRYKPMHFYRPKKNCAKRYSKKSVNK